MNKLTDILIDRMIGDMTKILVPKNANKSPGELNAMVQTKIEYAEKQIKDLFSKVVRDSYHYMDSADELLAKILLNIKGL